MRRGRQLRRRRRVRRKREGKKSPLKQENGIENGSNSPAAHEFHLSGTFSVTGKKEEKRTKADRGERRRNTKQINQEEETKARPETTKGHHHPPC